MTQSNLTKRSQNGKNTLNTSTLLSPMESVKELSLLLITSTNKSTLTSKININCSKSSCNSKAREVLSMNLKYWRAKVVSDQYVTLSKDGSIKSSAFLTTSPDSMRLIPLQAVVLPLETIFAK